MRTIKSISYLIFVLCVCSVTWAVQAIGDFKVLDNWTGLSTTTQQSPDGETCTRFTVPGKASFEYTEPKTYLGWETPTFADMHDEIAVEDWQDFRYIECQIKLSDDRPFELTCTIYPFQIGRPDYMKSTSTKAVIQGKGWQLVRLSLRDFDYFRHQGMFWCFIKGVSLRGKFIGGGEHGEVLISQLRLKRGKVVSVSAPVKSKPAQSNHKVVYDITVVNETNQNRHVSLDLVDTAWEVCESKLSESKLTLAPWETRQITLSVTMSDRLAVGGHENRQLTVIPDGRADLKEEICFKTVRAMQHPYLLHTEAGWQAVKAKAEKVDWARQAKQRYLENTRKWRVPKIGSGKYCYRKNQSNSLADCAIAWKLSGEEALAQKVIQMLRDFSDPENGYPTKIRSNEGTRVHQGMFFVRIAQAYDLVYDKMTTLDHERMEHTLRLFSHWVNTDILTGDGNNHQVSLVAGALHIALVMQDFAEVDRYLYDTGGYLDLMGTGILDDGHYFEGTANYNILVADIGCAIAQAFEPWGLDVKNWKIPPKYGQYVMVSDWAMRGDFLGMSFERQGPATRNDRQLKDLWDAVLEMSDYRGVVFPTADSVAINLTESRKESGFELAYYLWRDPAYVTVINKMENRSLLYGVVDLPETTDKLGQESYYSDNVGFSVLRSRAQDKDDRHRYQAVQRYGTHGGYHGHFDRTSLASLHRFGRTHSGPENAWYGYGSFMFKMWVQASNAHNMVVVDQRMQKPNDNKRLLFHSGDLMQVSATEIETPWIDPPYGGQTPYQWTMPQEKSWLEGRWLPTPNNPRPQGDTGAPSEPVLQRRLMVVTDDYVIMSDYLKGRKVHNYDNLFNCKGLVALEAKDKQYLRHRRQCDPDPYSSAQFITNCDWYQVGGAMKASFVLDWSKGDMGGRSSHSEPGIMNVDYYSLWPQKAEVMVANYPETLNVARHLYYTVKGDGKVLAEGKLAPWILGQVDIDVDVKGIKTLTVETRVEKAKSLKTIFLGNPHLLDVQGQRIALSDNDCQTQNIAAVVDTNRDYAGGKVTIFGKDYPRSLAAEPADRNQPGTIVIDLTGKKATRFQATLGGDYPVGGDDIHRKVIATRHRGREARFLSVIEFHEDKSVIASIQAPNSGEIVVQCTDGRVETIKIKNLDGDGQSVSVDMTVRKNGKRIAFEKAVTE